MSNFVAGLVRKGAGLPSPVAVRPSMRPHNVPGPIEAPTSAISLSGNAPDSLTTGEDSPLAARGAADEQRVVIFRPRGLLSGMHQLEETSAEIDVPLSIPQMRRSVAPQPHAGPAVTPEVVPQTPRSNAGNATASRSLVRPATAPSPNGEPVLEQASRSASTSSPVSEPKQRGQRSHLAEDLKSALLPVKVVPRQESRIVVSTARPSASAPQQIKQAREPRSIQVKIGRVEIRSTQPSAPTRATRKPATSGFADLTIARAHLDRSGW